MHAKLVRIVVYLTCCFCLCWMHRWAGWLCICMGVFPWCCICCLSGAQLALIEMLSGEEYAEGNEQPGMLENYYPLCVALWAL